MSGIQARLYEAYMRYPSGQEVYTAASGRVEALHEIFLELRQEGTDLLGLSEVRANISFITGTPEAAVVPGVVALLEATDRAGSMDDFAASFQSVRDGFPRICQALVENALVDLEATRQGVTVSEYLGGSWKEAVRCNQCVFWGSDDDMRRNLERYLRAGFTAIKVRVGVGALEDDKRRLAWIRSRCGDAFALAIDANGAWDAETALSNIETLNRFRLDYVEQPTRKGDWDGLERVAANAGVEIMIDEGLQTDEDVERVCANGGRISAHLKIAKAGGAAAMVSIGRKFDQNGVSYVVGQMNEGSLATAIAVHTAMALKPRVGELYGALGITNDPGEGVTYRNGAVCVPRRPGTGVTLRRDMMTMIWESALP